MVLALQILGIIALVSFVFLAFVAVSALSQLKQTFEKVDMKLDLITRELIDFKSKSILTLSSIDELSNDFSVSLEGINKINEKILISLDGFDKMSYQITSSVDAIHNTGKKIVDIVEPIELVIESVIGTFLPKISATGKFFKALNKGFNTFSNKVKE
ncbi:MAG: hypothetical protein RO257_17435 [Candidatus Kapabacteria bacterium]|nr:hypothetical protein [Candidatus Kapabacteria bacterium]